GHRDEYCRIHRSRAGFRPHRGQSRHEFRPGRRKFPALRYCHATRPRGPSSQTMAGCLFRAAMNLLARRLSVLTLIVVIFGRWAVVPPLRSGPSGPQETALNGPADRILIEKSARRMTVYRGGRALKTYHIALGFAPKGDKYREGDGRTPEGIFRIDRLN